jgi:hypothetical protein
MNTIKAGWKTSEAWIAAGVLISGFAVQLGFVNAADAATATDGWSKAVAAVFTLIVQATAAISYLRSRHILKQSALATDAAPINSDKTLSALVIAAVGMLVLGGNTCQAQAPNRPLRPPILQAEHHASCLPWRNNIENALRNQPQPQQQDNSALIAALMSRQSPQTDPALLIAVQSQTAILAQILASLQHTAPSAPQYGPPIITPSPQTPPIINHYYNAPPGVQPLPSAPLYPVQPLPIAPLYPVQPLPVAPLYPVQPLPVTPQYPVQPLPVVPIAPVQPLPLTPPAPQQQLPVAPKLGPQALPQVPIGPPVGYQRFTRTPVTHAVSPAPK